MNVLVVAAHPDDEVLGAGGTAARRSAAGDRVVVVILGEGATSRGDGADSQAAVARLRQQAGAAGEVLGIDEIRFADLPDNRFDSVDLLDIVRVVEGHLADTGPTTVLTHHPGDVNVDHRLTFEAVLAATRPQPGGTVRSVLSFEVPSSTDWAFGSIAPFRPTVFVDITDTLTAKLAALDVYADEARPAPHARSRDAVDHAARRWGSTVGVDAAEPFQLVWARR